MRRNEILSGATNLVKALFAIAIVVGVVIVLTFLGGAAIDPDTAADRDYCNDPAHYREPGC